jgi:oligopeptide transport system substrate-binding protein
VRSLAIFIVTASLIGLVSCDNSTRADRAAADGVLLLGNGAEPKALDPHLIQSVGDSNLMIALFEGLVSYDKDSDLTDAPGVAETWEHTDDFKIWTFHLRKDAKWSDEAASPVTAHDFIYGHRRILTQKLGSPYASMLYYLVNAKAYNENDYTFFLFGQEDDDSPVDWKILETVDRTGMEKIEEVPALKDCGLDGRRLGELLESADEFEWPKEIAEEKRPAIAAAVEAFGKRPKFNQTGLNHLAIDDLEELQADPALFLWPEAVPAAAREKIIARLLEFKEGEEKKGGQRLWEIANVGANALDDYTIQYTLDLPADFFPSVLKHATWLPVHRPTIEKWGNAEEEGEFAAMTKRFSLWQRPGNHVSNGPFQLKSWRVNHSVVVEPNPNYWDRETVKLNEIWFLPLNHEATEERMFRDGLVHVTYAVPANVRNWYAEERTDVLRREPYAGSYFYRINIGEKCEIPALKDKRVRKALALAIDRQALTKNVTLGGEQSATGFSFPIGLYEPPNRIKFDPKEARKLLAEAGFPDGEGLPRIEIKINTQETHRAIAESIQAMWKEHLNIKASIDNQEWKVYQESVYNQEYQIARSGWIADFMDATTYLDMWRTGDSNNNTGWGNKDYDRLLREAAVETSPEARRAKMVEAEEILLDELPMIPIYWYTRVYLIDPRVQNWNPLVLDKRDYKHVWLDPSK